MPRPPSRRRATQGRRGPGRAGGRPPPPRGKQIVIAYSSNIWASTSLVGDRLIRWAVLPGEQPSWTGPRRGGWRRRARRRRSAGATVLQPPAKPAPTGMLPPDPAEVTRRAELILSALARAGLTAFTPGERDLSIGPPLLRRLLAEHRIPGGGGQPVRRAGALFLRRRPGGRGRRRQDRGLRPDRRPPEEAASWKSWRLEARDPIAAARDEVAALHARGAPW